MCWPESTLTFSSYSKNKTFSTSSFLQERILKFFTFILKCTTAELVYGATLRLPGEFFLSPQPHALSDPTSYIGRMKDAMNNIRYQPTRQPSRQSTFVHKDLSQCTHVFVRHDATKPPLQPTYDGPFKVVERKDRHFIVELKPNRQDSISIDRLKPAYSVHTSEHSYSIPLHNSPPSPPSPQPVQVKQTRSGRHVKLPDRLMQVTYN